MKCKNCPHRILKYEYASGNIRYFHLSRHRKICGCTKPEPYDLKRLNIGCGNKKLENYINIDVSSKYSPDVIASMEKLPFPNESISEIFTSHTLEHIEDFRKGIEEMYRVLIKGGKLTIIVPYPSSLDTFHPHHIWYFSWNSMMPFIEGSEADDYEKVHFRRQERRFILAFGWIDRLFGSFMSKHPYFYEHSLAHSIFPAKEIRYELIK